MVLDMVLYEPIMGFVICGGEEEREGSEGFFDKSFRIDLAISCVSFLQIDDEFWKQI